MNISLNWLKKYIQLDMPVQQISEILTNIGLEVEGVKEVESIPGGLEGIVIAEVLTCDKHPNADKLSLCTVSTGEGDPLQIVCGAPNVAAGQKVLLATVGATLHPYEGEPFKIKKGKIRGEVSQGMICAEDEIGLGNDHDGIVVLPDSAEVGTAASEFYKLTNDTVFDIGLTPNRSDATSHLGVAKDLAAYIKVNIDDTISVNTPDVSSFQVELNAYPIEVEIKNEEDCPRFTGVTISNITVGTSPQWMQDHLKAVGVRPINTVVDITNYILHELGQPLHAYDADKIAGKKIIVDNLSSGTEFLSLDEKNRKLHEEDLIVCDGNRKGMCIAGVFGGAYSGVTENTTNIFLEAAHFSAMSIRKTSTRHLLRTDAAKVFEKGSDPSITEFAIKRAASLLMQHAGGTVSSDLVDIYPKKIAPVEIHLRYEKVNALVGEEIGKEAIHAILNAMEMQIIPVDDSGIRVLVPTNKADVLREVDLIEEILRIYGFNKVGIPEKIQSTIQYSEQPSRNQFRERIANYLSARAWNEMMGLSLMESREVKDWIGSKDDELVFINNTSNIHLDIMRPDVLLSGLKNILHNQNYQQTDVHLFEFAKSYKRDAEKYLETEFLSLFVKGKSAKESWANPGAKAVNLSQVQSAMQGLFSKLGLGGIQVQVEEDARFNYALGYFNGKTRLGVIGEIHSQIQEKLGIQEPIFAAEINFETLLSEHKSAKIRVKDLGKFPSSRRDLALVLDESVQFDDILGLVKQAKSKILKEVSLFDIYRSTEHLGENKKSYAVSFIFEDESKTLKDKDIDKVMKHLSASFEKQLAATIRQ